jgi:hypothetical protein
MNQELDDDLQALRRALPVPADREFPAGHYHQHEEHLMTSWLQMARKDTQAPRRPATPQRTRRRGLAALGVAAALGGLTLGATVLLPGTSSTRAVAATPKPLTYVHDAPPQDAAKILAQFADIAARQPDTTVTGTEHIKIRGWYLNSSPDAVANGQAASAVVATDTESWTTPNGATHYVSHSDAPEFPNAAARNVWKDHGWPMGPGNPEADDTSTHMWPGRTPTDPTALKTWLELGHPVTNGPDETLVAITDLLREQVLSAPERAAVLRVLATVPGLTYQGTTTDRAGRTGKAFALDNSLGGLPSRQTLIIDPATGRILDDERVLTKTAGMLGVPIPSVIEYTVYLEADTQPTPPR